MVHEQIAQVVNESAVRAGVVVVHWGVIEIRAGLEALAKCFTTGYCDGVEECITTACDVRAAHQVILIIGSWKYLAGPGELLDAGQPQLT